MSSTITNSAPRRGRDAQHPHHLPLKGWYDVLLRAVKEVAADNLGLVSAGVAFYILLSLFPTLAAAISLYAFIANPGDIEQQFASLAVLIPAEARPLLLDQIHALATSSDKSLGITFLTGLTLALFSAMKGMKAIITALNIVYDEKEKRGFLLLNFSAFLLTLASVAFLIVMLIMVVAVPVVLSYANLSNVSAGILSVVRWPVLLIVVTPVIAALYRYAPSRDKPKWRWVNWGAIFATVLWLAASLGFSIYVENFGNYNKAYGSIGALVILLMWFYISAYALLIGAELNAEMEHQTKVDTTEGRPRPMGERNAYVADTLGKSQ